MARGGAYFPNRFLDRQRGLTTRQAQEAQRIACLLAEELGARSGGARRLRVAAVEVPPRQRGGTKSQPNVRASLRPQHEQVRTIRFKDAFVSMRVSRRLNETDGQTRGDLH
jgi:hypothetical protein